MPIYEYMCNACGEIEEAFQKISDKPLKKCKHCSGKLHKLISQSSFHLKGTGWYVTDYANKKSQPAKTDNKTDKKEKASDTATKKAESSKPKSESSGQVKKA